jgi:hypothetical protein
MVLTHACLKFFKKDPLIFCMVPRGAEIASLTRMLLRGILICTYVKSGLRTLNI